MRRRELTWLLGAVAAWPGQRALSLSHSAVPACYDLRSRKAHHRSCDIEADKQKNRNCA
jgi:hypothetical protein